MKILIKLFEKLARVGGGYALMPMGRGDLYKYIPQTRPFALTVG